MKKFFALLSVVACLVAAQAQAGNFTITPTVVAVYDSAFTLIDPAPAGTLGTNVTIQPAGPLTYEVQFLMTLDSLAAGEDGFGLIGFNIDLGAGLSDSGDAGWTPNNPPVDTNGPTPGGTGNNMFGTNTDSGPSGTDEQGMLVQMATGQFTNAVDPRRAVGEAGSTFPVPFNLGTMFILWDNVTNATLSIGGAQFAVKMTDGSFVGNQAGTTGTVTFGVPEPTSIAMVGLSMVGLAFRRRLA
jgi:hypothetical protein